MARGHIGKPLEGRRWWVEYPERSFNEYGHLPARDWRVWTVERRSGRAPESYSPCPNLADVRIVGVGLRDVRERHCRRAGKNVEK